MLSRRATPRRQRADSVLRSRLSSTRPAPLRSAPLRRRFARRPDSTTASRPNRLAAIRPFNRQGRPPTQATEHATACASPTPRQGQPPPRPSTRAAAGPRREPRIPPSPPHRGRKRTQHSCKLPQRPTNLGCGAKRAQPPHLDHRGFAAALTDERQSRTPTRHCRFVAAAGPAACSIRASTAPTDGDAGEDESTRCSASGEPGPSAGRRRSACCASSPSGAQQAGRASVGRWEPSSPPATARFSHRVRGIAGRRVPGAPRGQRPSRYGLHAEAIAWPVKRWRVRSSRSDRGTLPTRTTEMSPLRRRGQCAGSGTKQSLAARAFPGEQGTP